VLLKKKNLRRDPANRNWTIPKSYGVWRVTLPGDSKEYREGNNPVRENELRREYRQVSCLALYSTKDEAVEHARRLNGGA
jgi:hypothetical protein